MDYVNETDNLWALWSKNSQGQANKPGGTNPPAPDPAPNQAELDAEEKAAQEEADAEEKIWEAKEKYKIDVAKGNTQQITALWAEYVAQVES